MAYSQNDPAWKNVLLGFNTSRQWTIGTAGCLVTAIANICREAGHDLTPLQVNNICKDRGWFVNGGELTRNDIPALLCSNLGFVGRKYWTGPTDVNYFEDVNDPNVMYIVEIDASPARGVQKHFMVVTAKPDANGLEVDDSWDGRRKAISSYGTPSVIIQSAMKFVKVAPPAPEPPPVPVVVTPPTPEPVVVPPPPPAAPVTGKPAEKYTLVTLMSTYKSFSDAMAGTNPQATLVAGTYFVYAKEGKAYNLTPDNMKEGVWVNTLYNALPVPPKVERPTPPAPKPVDWRDTYKSFYSDNHSETYRLLQDYNMREHNGARNAVLLSKGQKVNVLGTFAKDGIAYYRPRANNDEYFRWYYGIPQTDDAGNAILVKVPNNEIEVPKKLSDFLQIWRNDLKDIMDIYVHKKRSKE